LRRQRQVVRRSQDRSLAGELESNLFLDRTMAWDAALEEKIQALTPEQIHAAMKKYIDADEMIMVLAGDFARAEAASKP
jgi:zinc protease